MKEQIMRQIIEKQESIIDSYKIYCRHLLKPLSNRSDLWLVIGCEMNNILNDICAELTILNEQLKQAEAEFTEYELETLKLTPIPSGWICPRCQKVHNWMVQSCDCPPNVITASTTIVRDESPIKENIKCDVCGCHPSVIIRTTFGTFCQEHARYI